MRSTNIPKKELVLNQMPFLNAVFAVIEFITKAELTNTSKKLVISYLNQSTDLPLVERAHQAIARYTQTRIPAPDQGRQEAQPPHMLKQLLQRLEGEASRLRDT
jgi:hypothetical protein